MTDSVTLHRSTYDALIENTRLLKEFKKDGNVIAITSSPKGISSIVTKEAAMNLIAEDIAKELNYLKTTLIEKNSYIEEIQNMLDEKRVRYKNLRNKLLDKKWYQFMIKE